MIYQFDHRYSDYESCTLEEIDSGNPNKFPNKKEHINYVVKPRYWIKEEKLLNKLNNWGWHKNWFLAIRKTARASDKRTSIATIIPSYPSVASLRLFMSISAKEALFLVSAINSFVFDYCAKQKVDLAMAEYIIKQLPLPSYALWEKFIDILLPNCLKLVYTNHELRSFAMECGYNGPPYKWNNEERIRIRAEVDGIMAFLYGLDRSDIEYILDKFLKSKEADLLKYDEFLIKKLVLEAYDKFSKQKELFE